MSPQLSQRPSSPPVNPGSPVPYRPGSPFRGRTATSIPLPSVVQSGNVPLASTPSAQSKQPKPDIAVDLVVQNIPRELVTVEKPFTIAFTVTASASVPFARPNETCKQRVLTLVVQHVQPARVDPTAALSGAAPVNATAAKQDILSSRGLSPVLSTPSPSGTPYRGEFQDLLAKRLLVASPRTVSSDGEEADHTEDGDATPAPHGRAAAFSVDLPPPFTQVTSGNTNKAASSNDVIFLGNSAIVLPSMRVLAPPRSLSDEGQRTHERNISTGSTESDASSELDTPLGELVAKGVVSQDFELSYMPMKTGFLKVGGLRILLVEDRLLESEEVDGIAANPEDAPNAKQFSMAAITLKEWEVIGEVWVKS